MEKKKLNLPALILIALAAGIIVGLICYFTGTASFTANYLKPIGTIFINLLKFIVVPIVLLSMIDGIISMGDLKKVGSVGWKTVVYFLVTTAIACVIGLVIGGLFDGAGWFPQLALEEGAVWDKATSAMGPRMSAPCVATTHAIIVKTPMGESLMMKSMIFSNTA